MNTIDKYTKQIKEIRKDQAKKEAIECSCCCHHSHCECMREEGCKHCD